jgi:hypothetical protein
MLHDGFLREEWESSQKFRVSPTCEFWKLWPLLFLEQQVDMGSKPFKSDAQKILVVHRTQSHPQEVPFHLQPLKSQSAPVIKAETTWLESFEENQLLRVTYTSTPTR